MALPEGPQSRAEQYLAKIAGQAGSLPEAPRSRVEQYLDYIAANGTVSKEEIAEQVSDWLEENIHEDPTVVIDSSLSISGAAADAKVSGDEVTALKQYLGYDEALDLSESTLLKFSIVANGTWNAASSSSSIRSSVDEIPDGTKKITISTSNDAGCYIAFLSSYNGPVQGNAPDFSENYGERIGVEAGSNVEYQIGSDMKYLYTTRVNSSGVNVTPTVTCYRSRINDAISVAAFEGGSVLANQTGNTICFVNAANISDAPSGVDLSTGFGWLFTCKDGLNGIQILFYSNGAEYKRFYTNGAYSNWNSN